MDTYYLHDTIKNKNFDEKFISNLVMENHTNDIFLALEFIDYKKYENKIYNWFLNVINMEQLKIFFEYYIKNKIFENNKCPDDFIKDMFFNLTFINIRDCENKKYVENNNYIFNALFKLLSLEFLINEVEINIKYYEKKKKENCNNYAKHKILFDSWCMLKNMKKFLDDKK